MTTRPRSANARMRSVLALAIMLAGLAALSYGASAGAGTLVDVQPSAGSYQVGEQFAVEVRVEDVLDLYGADTLVAFDPSRLEVIEAQVVPRTDLLSPPWLILYNQVDNQAGTIWYVVTQLSPQPPVSGSGALFEFTFRALAPGRASVDIAAQTLSTIDGDLIPAIARGAVYLVGHQAYLPLILRHE